MSNNSTNLLAQLRDRLQTKSVNMEKEQFVLTAISKIHAHFRPHPRDLPYSDIIIVAQTSGTGSCYCYHEDPEIPLDLLGKDSRDCLTNSNAVNIAILDAAYSRLRPAPKMYYRLEGNSSQKAEARANLVLSEVDKLFHESNLSSLRITMVGAVGSILSKLIKRTQSVFATDLDPTLIGKELGGVVVEDGFSRTLERVSQSNVALVTGMTLETNTLEAILQTAHLHKVKVILFAQTGGNLAGELIEMGVDSIISEEYPFYMFPGSTIARIYRRETRQ